MQLICRVRTFQCIFKKVLNLKFNQAYTIIQHNILQKPCKILQYTSIFLSVKMVVSKKINNFTQREYTIEDFEKLYSNNEWQNNE